MSLKLTEPNKLIFPVYEFRPLPDDLKGEIFRYNNGKWTKDDGEYDLAFLSYDDCMCLGIELSYHQNIIWSWVSNHWSSREPRHRDGNAWHYMLREGAKDWGGSWDRDNHPNQIAYESGTHVIAEKCGCSNGQTVDFNPKDAHIINKLVRERDTKKVVVYPYLLI